MRASLTRVVVISALSVTVVSTGAQAFCFSFGFGNDGLMPHSRYPVQYPPPYPAYYPSGPVAPVTPGVMYSPVYPPPQPAPYVVPVPLQPGG